jgi:hypothetical protein
MKLRRRVSHRDVLGVNWPPPYKDFAKELAQLTNAEEALRGSARWQEGWTLTRYLIPDLNDAVVELADEKRKQT